MKFRWKQVINIYYYLHCWIRPFSGKCFIYGKPTQSRTVHHSSDRAESKSRQAKRISQHHAAERGGRVYAASVRNNHALFDSRVVEYDISVSGCTQLKPIA